MELIVELTIIAIGGWIGVGLFTTALDEFRHWRANSASAARNKRSARGHA